MYVFTYFLVVAVCTIICEYQMAKFPVDVFHLYVMSLAMWLLSHNQVRINGNRAKYLFNDFKR